MKIAVIGSEGFLGSQLCRFFQLAGQQVYGIDKHNCDISCDHKFDVLINANGNSRRYWANENIIEDFQSSTVSVYESIVRFTTRLHIYISSVDVYEKHDRPANTEERACVDPSALCPYGFHKYLSELIVKKHSSSYLVLRCSAMVGHGMKKGPVKDILEGRSVFVTPDSKLQFISTSEISKIISCLIDRDVCNEIVNVGGIGSVTIKDLSSMSRTSLSVSPDAQHQVYEMKVSKLKSMFPIKTSEDYILEYLDQ